MNLYFCYSVKLFKNLKFITIVNNYAVSNSDDISFSCVEKFCGEYDVMMYTNISP